MKNNLKLLIILIFIISAPAWGEVKKAVIENVSAEVFTEKINSMKNHEDFMIIDVRTPQEFNAGRIKGAVNIDFYSSSFADKLKELDKEKTYFIYCRSGNRSGQTLRGMASMGFKEVYNLEYGIIADTMEIIK